MKRDTRRLQGKAGLELFEEAFHLLRSAPATALASYYLGTLPLVLGLLWFWADMSRSPFAYQHLGGATLGLALLFVWMKFWQAIYARALRASMAAALSPLRPNEIWHIVVTQSALPPTGLFLLPLALLPVLTFPFMFAFYQNLTVLPGGESPTLGALVKRAARQASLWQRQNLSLLLAGIGFGLVVFLNWTTFCFLIPNLLKMLTGFESIYTRSSLSMLNSTFFAAMLGLTYLSVDPLLKAVYSLRCFYGESLQSGEDLKAELRQFAPALTAPLVMLGLLLVCNAAALESAETTLPSGPRSSAINPNSAKGAAPALSAPELDRAIQEVVRQPKYTWRMPREKLVKPEAEQSGVIGRFLERVGELIRRGLKAAWDALENLLRKLFQGRKPAPATSSSYGWIFLLQIFPYVLIALVAAGLGFLGYRLWRSRRRPAATLASEAMQPEPDLTDENLGAEQLPEDGWTKLARELLARGEWRLAMRAFYLASLAHLSARNLISLARFKSNRDYERELRRRGHAFPELLAMFGENVSVFERIWYGMHEASGELVTQFAANVERMRGG